MSKDFILKGNFVYCDSNRKGIIHKNSYAVCIDGFSEGIFSEIPEKFHDIQIIDCSDNIILPGLVDLHVHAPQYGYRGVGFDCELLEWLNIHTFPVESKFADPEYADIAYRIFVDDLKNSATTRAVIFGTIHKDSTLHLMKLLEVTGLRTFVGKVNMDRNSPDYYIEESAEKSLIDTRKFLEEADFERTKPIITPRFIPSCTDSLMEGLSRLKEEFSSPMQSHLSENQEEIKWVHELCPESENYLDAYDRSGILDNGPSIMAHCIWSDEGETALLKRKNVFVAHCPKSNLNLASGIAPIRKYLELGLNVGLGSDVAGGENLSIFEEMAKAIQVSKMYYRYIDETKKPLNIFDALFLATRGGGKFFGKVGSFEKGFEFDAVAIDDSSLRTNLSLDIKARLERIIYNSSYVRITKKICCGETVI